MTTNTKSLALLITTTAMIALGVAAASAQDRAQAPQPEVTQASQDGDHRGGGRHEGRRGGMFGGHMSGRALAGVFAEIDADGSGSVTQAEIDTFRAAKVAEVDQTGDGALSLEEFETLYNALTRSRMVSAFQGLDADGDGVVTPAEMDQRFGNIVDRMDRDDDGALTLGRGRRG
jgi:hypothetical protein